MSDLTPAHEVKPVLHQSPICVTGPRPKLGSQPSATANTRISRDAEQKGGQRHADQADTMNKRDSGLLR